MNVKYIALPILAAILFGTTTAHAENFTVEMTEDGFSTNHLIVSEDDSITFVNTHYVTDVNLEPHAISDPFAVPYTAESYYILDDSTTSQTYTISNCESYVFHDRYFDVEPIVVECGGIQVTETPSEHEEDAQLIIDTTSDSDDQNLTMELTLALEKIGILQNQVTLYEDNIFVLENQISQLTSQIETLQSENVELENTLNGAIQERDYFEKQWVDWKEVAMEQLRVMIDVLGI